MRILFAHVKIVCVGAKARRESSAVCVSCFDLLVHCSFWLAWRILCALTSVTMPVVFYVLGNECAACRGCEYCSFPRSAETACVGTACICRAARHTLTPPIQGITGAQGRRDDSASRAVTRDYSPWSGCFILSMIQSDYPSIRRDRAVT